MKKITIILTLLTVSMSFAQFNGAGKYRLKNNKYPVYLSHDGTLATTASSAGDGSSTDTTVFQFVAIGTTSNYDIVVNTENQNLRANSSTAIEVRAWDGNGSTSAPEMWSVAPSATEGVFNILTAETSTPRYLVVQTDETSVGYSGSDFTRTQWIVEPLATLSTDDLNKSSIFISNPVTNQIIIGGLGNKVNKIEIFNLVGQSMLKKDTKGVSSLRLEANTLTSGLYFIKFYGETSTLTKKIIKK